MDSGNSQILWLFQISYWQSVVALLFLIFIIVSLSWTIKRKGIKKAFLISFILGFFGAFIFSYMFLHTITSDYWVGNYNWYDEVSNWLSLPYKIFFSLIFFFFPLYLFLGIINVSFRIDEKIKYHRIIISSSLMVLIGILVAVLLIPALKSIDIVPYSSNLNEANPEVNILTIFTYYIPNSISIFTTKFFLLAVIGLGILFGVAIQVIKKQDRITYYKINDFFHEFKWLVDYSLQKILILIPFIIATTIPLLFSGQSLYMLGKLLVFFVIFLIGLVVVLGLQQGIIKVLKSKEKYNPFNQTTLIGFTSSSNAAIINLERDKNLPSSSSHFSMFFNSTSGLSASGGYFPSIIIFLTLLNQGVEIDFGTILIVILVVWIFSFITIGLPGSDYITSSLILYSFGLPIGYLLAISNIEPIMYPFKSFVNTNGVVINAEINNSNTKEWSYR